MADHQSPDADTVPIARFDLGGLPESERYTVWKESISVVFDVARDPEDMALPFAASLTTCHLGAALLVETASNRQFFHRQQPLINLDGLDHCIVQLYTQGTTQGQWGSRHSLVRPGDVFLLDLAQPVKSLASDFRNLTLMLPRHLLTPYLGAPENFHGQVLPRESARGRLLGEHLLTLWRIAETTPADETQGIAQGLVDLVGAYFGSGQIAEDRPEVGMALHETICRHIELNLTDPNLTSECLAARFNVSRSYLYKLFQPAGGVARYIQRQRLRQSFVELTKSAGRPRRINEIAYSLGFRNEAHFSRVFRHTFGVSPSEARAIGLQAGQLATEDDDQALDRRYEQWVRKLSLPER